jgi:AcrR family transcriptional regulator
MSRRSTRDRLLDSAIEVFAENGYRDATIADVCERANANIASVNYHFDSKENLFRHVLRQVILVANEAHPIDGGLAADAPADRRLHAFMSALIHRNLDLGAAGLFTKIMLHQGTRESGPDDVIQSEIDHHIGSTLEGILAELLGTRAKKQLVLAKMNVIGLCVFPNIAHRLRKQLFPQDPGPKKLKAFVDHQYRFALAGLSSLVSASV